MGYTHTVCPYCSCGCGMLVETRGGRLIGTQPGAQHPSSQGGLCIRGWNAATAPNHHDRITAPFVRKNSELVQASADEVLQAITHRIAGLRARDDASILFCLGPACTNEDAYAVRKLACELNARACATGPAGLSVARRAMQSVYGRSYLPGGLDYITNADLVWVFGADLIAFPQIASRLSAAKKQGASVVQFDIFASADMDSRRTFVAIPPNQFGLLPLLLQKAAFESGHIPDMAESAPTFPAYADFWRSGRMSALPEHSWLPDSRLKELTAAFMRAQTPAVIIGERFLSSYEAGESTRQLMQALVLLSAGERIILMTGESNSWGTWDILCPQKEDTDALLDLFNPAGARKFDAIFIIGDDLMRRSFAKTGLTERLDASGLVVLIDSYHSELEPCAYAVLPSVSFAEQWGSLTSKFGRVQQFRQAVRPAGESAAICDWIARIGRQLGIRTWPDSETGWFEAMRDETPLYKTKLLKDPHAETPYAEFMLDETTAPAFCLPKLPVAMEIPKEFPLQLCYGSHPALWSTGRLSEREEILRREVNQSFLHISPADLASAGLKNGLQVKVISQYGEAAMTLQENRSLPAGSLLAIPLPADTAQAFGGFFPDAEYQTAGMQPIPVRLEKCCQ